VLLDIESESFLISYHFSEVRCAALVNIPLVPVSLDIILDRTRNVDPVTGANRCLGLGFWRRIWGTRRLGRLLCNHQQKALITLHHIQLFSSHCTLCK
jgi:hypothetical protein